MAHSFIVCSRKLKNIEDTEKAKRRLAEEKEAAKLQADDEEFAADRCESAPVHRLASTADVQLLTVYRARRPLESDADALAKARREAAAGEAPEPSKRHGGSGRRELATDDQVSETRAGGI